MTDIFEGKAFDVEHALDLYAASFAVLPAEAIYDDKALAPLMAQIQKCHFYLIGLVPKIDIVGVEPEKDHFNIIVEILGSKYPLKWPLAPGERLLEAKGAWFIVDDNGEAFYPSDSAIQVRLAN